MKAKGGRGQGVAFWEEEKRRQVPAPSSARHRLNGGPGCSRAGWLALSPCRTPVRVTRSLFQDPEEKQR